MCEVVVLWMGVFEGRSRRACSGSSLFFGCNLELQSSSSVH